MKKKCYDDGGLTFAEMSDEDRASSAKAAIEALNARQAKASEEAGGASEKKTEPRRAASKSFDKGSVSENLRDMDMAGVDTGYSNTEARRSAARAGSEHASGKATPSRTERAPSSVKAEPITGPKAAKSAEAAMPDVAARKAATAERMSKSRSGKLGTQGVYGMKAGGSVSSASKRGDGCAIRGKTKGRMV